MLYWGATGIDVASEMPGDDLIAHPLLETTRAIIIKAETNKIWPWLIQMGQGRGGFYSYDWLENLIGLNIHNSDRIIPELQSLKVGDIVSIRRGIGVKVRSIASENLLVLAEGLISAADRNCPDGVVDRTWAFTLVPQDRILLG
jgi:hypothetical protein